MRQSQELPPAYFAIDRAIPAIDGPPNPHSGGLNKTPAPLQSTPGLRLSSQHAGESRGHGHEEGSIEILFSYSIPASRAPLGPKEKDEIEHAGVRALYAYLFNREPQSGLSSDELKGDILQHFRDRHGLKELKFAIKVHMVDPVNPAKTYLELLPSAHSVIPNPTQLYTDAITHLSSMGYDHPDRGSLRNLLVAAADRGHLHEGQLAALNQDDADMRIAEQPARDPLMSGITYHRPMPPHPDRAPRPDRFAGAQQTGRDVGVEL